VVQNKKALWGILKNKKYVYTIIVSFLGCFVLSYLYQILHQNNFNLSQTFSNFSLKEYLIYCGVGLAAQIIDGALGMAYGISSSTFLINAGVSPAVASASVHIAEVFTSGVSGLSHLRFGNVNKKLFQHLVVPGVIGAIVGAYFVSSFDGDTIKPFVSAYLLIMGIVVIRKAFKVGQKKQKTKKLSPLALLGGFVDSIGGGGWGPVVSTTLISKGRNPKYTIGSVNLAEFFVAFASASTFVFILGTNNWIVIAGLITGGVFAAPFAAMLVRRVKVKFLMVFVGSLIIALSLRTIVMAVLNSGLF
jgi:uncharacterized protein